MAPLTSVDDKVNNIMFTHNTRPACTAQTMTYLSGLNEHELQEHRVVLWRNSNISQHCALTGWDRDP